LKDLLVAGVPCVLPPLSTADLATGHLIFVNSPATTEQQLNVVDILAQQLAEQIIPLSLPLKPAFQTCHPDTASSSALTEPTAKQALLDRYLACLQKPIPMRPNNRHSSSQSSHPEHRHSFQSRFIDATEHSQRDSQADNSSGYQQPNATSALTYPQLSATQACINVHHSCHRDITGSNSMPSNYEPPCSSTSQSAKALVLTSSRGQTWKGLALRQAFLGRDAAERDGEAAVQDAAGGGGLLHGGAEDGGEGGGPSRSACCACSLRS